MSFNISKGNQLPPKPSPLSKPLTRRRPPLESYPKKTSQSSIGSQGASSCIDLLAPRDFHRVEVESKSPHHFDVVDGEADATACLATKAAAVEDIPTEADRLSSEMMADSVDVEDDDAAARFARSVGDVCIYEESLRSVLKNSHSNINSILAKAGINDRFNQDVASQIIVPSHNGSEKGKLQTIKKNIKDLPIVTEVSFKFIEAHMDSLQIADMYVSKGKGYKASLTDSLKTLKEEHLKSVILQARLDVISDSRVSFSGGSETTEALFELDDRQILEKAKNRIIASIDIFHGTGQLSEESKKKAE